jgi:prophage regulatory protein
MSFSGVRRERLDMHAFPASTALSPSAPAAAAQLPQTGFLRQPQVLAFVPISKSTLWRRVQAKTFPMPVKLSARVTAWRVEDIRHWIDAQASAERS